MKQPKELSKAKSASKTPPKALSLEGQFKAQRSQISRPRQSPASNLEQSIINLLLSLGEDPNREGLLETPERVVRSYKELFRGYNSDPNEVIKTFDAEDYDEMVIAKNITFFSTCEHHLLPFHGKAHIGYLPDKKIIGLSKFGRLVDIFTRRIQNQERITTQIATFLQSTLEPKGVGVVLEASHLCMVARGVEKQSALITTSAFKGYFKKNVNTRQEFLSLIK
jgi:GTP cyclohydrolase IA